MNRRDFLTSAVATGSLYTLGAVPRLGSAAYGMGFPAIDHRVLVKLMLPGGPDLRHLFPPAFDADPTSFGYRFWQAKARAHAIADSASAFEARWENDYFHVGAGDTVFGIRNNCGWLKSMWDAGKVAVVNNVFGGRSRDHAHCIDIIDQGDMDFAPNQAYRAGWGGRLATEADGNVLALTASPRPFCYGPHPTDPDGFDNARLIGARNTRQLSLYTPPDGASPLEGDATIARGLKAYYGAKRTELERESLFYRFVELERILREFGEPIDERLATIPVPASITALMEGGLASPQFGEQIRNLHDAFACHDIVSLRVASLDYGGWDSHQEQVGLIEQKLDDIFGTGKALDTLFGELPADALDNLVLVIAGEFGRQLRANGDNGTDHGEGNSVIVIGNGVAGGVYGEMFPPGELERLDDPSPQITGLTGLDHVFGAVSDWVQPGAGDVAFPLRGIRPLEGGVDLGQLMT